jgi:hypothetical protein
MQMFLPQGFKMGVDSADLEFQSFLSTMYTPVHGPYLYPGPKGMGTAMVAPGQPDNGYGYPPGCMESGDPLSDITPCGFTGPSTPAQLAQIIALFGPPPSYVPAQFQNPVWVNGQVQSWFGGDASGGNPFGPAPGNEPVNYGAPSGTVNQTYTQPPAEVAAIAKVATATVPPATPILPIATPSIPVSAPAIASSVAPASTTQPAVTTPPVANWFTDVGSEIISGIPNWGLVAAGVGGLFLMMGGKKR